MSSVYTRLNEPANALSREKMVCDWEEILNARDLMSTDGRHFMDRSIQETLRHLRQVMTALLRQDQGIQVDLPILDTSHWSQKAVTDCPLKVSLNHVSRDLCGGTLGTMSQTAKVTQLTGSQSCNVDSEQIHGPNDIRQRSVVTQSSETHTTTIVAEQTNMPLDSGDFTQNLSIEVTDDTTGILLTTVFVSQTLSPSVNLNLVDYPVEKPTSRASETNVTVTQENQKVHRSRVITHEAESDTEPMVQLPERTRRAKIPRQRQAALTQEVHKPEVRQGLDDTDISENLPKRTRRGTRGARWKPATKTE